MPFRRYPMRSPNSLATDGLGDQTWKDSLTFRQADFVRNGNAKQVMSMSKEDTTTLWNSVQDSENSLLFAMRLITLADIVSAEKMTSPPLIMSTVAY
jgi:hypothetical protein